MDLVCLGELLVDMFPTEYGKGLAEVSAFRPVPGGAPANVAVAAVRLGAASAFIGKVGDDPFGRHLAATLEREGVNVRGLRFDPNARTSLAFIALPDPHRAEFLFYRNPGADGQLDPLELDRELLADTRILHIGSVSLSQNPTRRATLEAVRFARAAGAIISFDVNYRPTLWSDPGEALELIHALIPLTDVLKVNGTEFALLCENENYADGCRRLLARGPQLCVITLGASGCYFAIESGGDTVPGFAVETVDSTGCGDAFIAGLLTQIARTPDWRGQLTPRTVSAWLRHANAAGALTARALGVIPALPTAAAVQEFLNQQNA